MTKSITNPIPRIRAALMLRKVPTTIAHVARKHRANYKTCYAALGGKRPGNSPEVQRAIREIRALAGEAA